MNRNSDNSVLTGTLGGASCHSQMLLSCALTQSSSPTDPTTIEQSGSEGSGEEDKDPPPPLSSSSIQPSAWRLNAKSAKPKAVFSVFNELLHCLFGL